MEHSATRGGAAIGVSNGPWLRGRKCSMLALCDVLVVVGGEELLLLILLREDDNAAINASVVGIGHARRQLPGSRAR